MKTTAFEAMQPQPREHSTSSRVRKGRVGAEILLLSPWKLDQSRLPLGILKM